MDQPQLKQKGVALWITAFVASLTLVACGGEIVLPGTGLNFNYTGSTGSEWTSHYQSETLAAISGTTLSIPGLIRRPQGASTTVTITPGFSRLPSGWVIRFVPTSLQIAPGDTPRTYAVEIEVPPGATGQYGIELTVTDGTRTEDTDFTLNVF